jgi:hypothetical protein
MLMFSRLGGLSAHQIASQVIQGELPEIPDSVIAGARELTANAGKVPPTFAAIVDRLMDMEFNVTVDVNPAKLAEFVKRIDDWDSRHWED